MKPVTEIDLAAIGAERERIRAAYLQPDDARPASSARGLHHFAVVARDVEETIRFYQGLLEFPLTEIFENRDYQGSNHFFFDIGHDNLLAFFDFPGLDVGEYAEVLGGLHHIAISVEPKPLKLKSGAQKTAALVLTNTSKSDATLVLDHGCGRILEVTYEMLASNGERVDLEEGGCGTGRGCGLQVSAFSLTAGGQLRLEFPLVARVEKFDADCKAARVRPMPKGTYELKVYSGVAPDQSTKITIE